MYRLFIFLLIFDISGLSMTQGTEPDDANIAYGDSDTARHWLDVYLPDEGEAPYPTLMIIHGGGFQFGRKEVVAPIAAYFAGRGFATVTPNYRLTPNDTYPAQVEDIFCALAWIHANADSYGFDTSRVFVAGESAGGYLAAMVGVVDNPADFLSNCPNILPETDYVRGIIPYYPMSGLGIDHYHPLARGLFNLFLGVLPGEAGYDARYTEASPATWIDGTEPPLLIINGTNDPLLPPQDSALLAAALSEAGVDVELALVDANEHAFISSLDTQAGLSAAQMAEAFMLRVGAAQP